jgi:hypothetical protein
MHILAAFHPGVAPGRATRRFVEAAGNRGDIADWRGFRHSAARLASDNDTDRVTRKSLLPKSKHSPYIACVVNN